MNNRCFPGAGETPDPLPCVGLIPVTLGRDQALGASPLHRFPSRREDRGAGPGGTAGCPSPTRPEPRWAEGSPRAPRPRLTRSPFLPLFLALPVHSVSSRARAPRPA